MTRIPPQALSCDPVGVDAQNRLGVLLGGLGGLGVEVIEPGKANQPGRPILEPPVSYLPVLVYSWLRPQYARCTLANALAADYAHGWVTGQGGHPDRQREILDKASLPMSLF